MKCRYCDGYGYNEIEPEVKEELCRFCDGTGESYWAEVQAEEERNSSHALDQMI